MADEAGPAALNRMTVDAGPSQNDDKSNEGMLLSRDGSHLKEI